MNGLSAQLLFGLALLLAGLALALLAYGRRPAFAWARPCSGLAVIAGLVFTISGIVNAGGAPITYVNPTTDTVASVDRGALLYDASCARCHGAEYRGDGPAAGTTEVPPSILVSGLLASHSDSDLYAWIRDGLPGGMPGSATSLTDAQRWDLVNFLRGINGQGPSPDLVPASSRSALAGGFGLVGGTVIVLIGWYVGGLRRGRASIARGRR